MNKIEEIKELKALLDEGIITEEEFSEQKKRLLEIENVTVEQQDTTPSPSESKMSLDDYEKKLIQEIEESKTAEEINKEEGSNSYDKKEDNNLYDKELLKKRAKLEADEAKRKKRGLRKNAKAEKTDSNKVEIYDVGLTVLKWILTVFMFLLAVIQFSMITDYGKNYAVYGAFFVLFALMACPPITRFTSLFRTYTKFKKYIVIFLVILLFLLIGVLS